MDREKTQIIYCNPSKSGDYTIPNTVVSILLNAFRGCRQLTSVTIPDSVRSIGWSAFDSCSGIKSITIPASVTSISELAFDCCYDLKTVSVPNNLRYPSNAFPKGATINKY